MNAEEERSGQYFGAPFVKRALSRRARPLLLGLLVLGLGVLLWIGFGDRKPPGGQDPARPVSRAESEPNPEVVFEPFLIPLGEGARYPFVSLSFSVELSPGLSDKEMKQTMGALRGFVYDRLKEEFRKVEGIPLFQTVKESIERAVRLKLPGRQVKEIYISQFLAF